MRLSLAILTYNEIVGLQSIFDRIPRENIDEIFAVDGGSTDGTIQFFRDRNVPVFFQKVKGRGEAFRVAFQNSSGDAIIFFSPDGNEDVRDIPKFRSFLEAGHDMVIANRMSRGGHNEEDESWLKWRKWANQTFTLIANIAWNRQSYVADTINGFRAITKKAWDVIRPDSCDYSIEYQCSIRAFKKSLKIVEFPTNEFCRLDARPGSPSLRTGISFLKLFFRELS